MKRSTKIKNVYAKALKAIANYKQSTDASWTVGEMKEIARQAFVDAAELRGAEQKIAGTDAGQKVCRMCSHVHSIGIDHCGRDIPGGHYCRCKSGGRSWTPGTSRPWTPGTPFRWIDRRKVDRRVLSTTVRGVSRRVCLDRRTAPSSS